MSVNNQDLIIIKRNNDHYKVTLGEVMGLAPTTVVYDNTDSTSASQALSANQGRVLQQQIDQINNNSASAPTEELT